MLDCDGAEFLALLDSRVWCILEEMSEDVLQSLQKESLVDGPWWWQLGWSGGVVVPRAGEELLGGAHTVYVSCR